MFSTQWTQQGETYGQTGYSLNELDYVVKNVPQGIKQTPLILTWNDGSVLKCELRVKPFKQFMNQSHHCLLETVWVRHTRVIHHKPKLFFLKIWGGWPISLCGNKLCVAGGKDYHFNLFVVENMAEPRSTTRASIQFDLSLIPMFFGIASSAPALKQAPACKTEEKTPPKKSMKKKLPLDPPSLDSKTKNPFKKRRLKVDDETYTDTKKKGSRCKICSVEVSGTNVQRTHVAAHHPFQCTAIVYVCKCCPPGKQTVSTYSNVVRHMSIKNKQPLFKCDTCSSTFPDKDSAMRHCKRFQDRELHTYSKVSQPSPKLEPHRTEFRYLSVEQMLKARSIYLSAERNLLRKKLKDKQK